VIHTINTEFQMKLETLIHREIERLTDNLVLGGGINDFSDYCHTKGQIAGLKLAADQFDEVNEFLDSKR